MKQSEHLQKQSANHKETAIEILNELLPGRCNDAANLVEEIMKAAECIALSKVIENSKADFDAGESVLLKDDSVNDDDLLTLVQTECLRLIMINKPISAVRYARMKLGLELSAAKSFVAGLTNK